MLAISGCQCGDRDRLIPPRISSQPKGTSASRVATAAHRIDRLSRPKSRSMIPCTRLSAVAWKSKTDCIALGKPGRQADAEPAAGHSPSCPYYAHGAAGRWRRAISPSHPDASASPVPDRIAQLGLPTPRDSGEWCSFHE